MTATAVKAETSKRTVAASIARQAAQKAAAKSTAKDKPTDKPATTPKNSTAPKTTEKKAPKRELDRPAVPDKPGALTMGQFSWTAAEVASILKAYGTMTDAEALKMLATHYKGVKGCMNQYRKGNASCAACGERLRKTCALHLLMAKPGDKGGKAFWTHLAPREIRDARWVIQQLAAKTAPATETK